MQVLQWDKDVRFSDVESVRVADEAPPRAGGSLGMMVVATASVRRGAGGRCSAAPPDDCSAASASSASSSCSCAARERSATEGLQRDRRESRQVISQALSCGS